MTPVGVKAEMETRRAALVQATTTTSSSSNLVFLVLASSAATIPTIVPLTRTRQAALRLLLETISIAGSDESNPLRTLLLYGWTSFTGRSFYVTSMNFHVGPTYFLYNFMNIEIHKKTGCSCLV